MRKEYLRSVAETFLAEYKSQLQDLCFVFPNKRSSLFFKKYLGEQAQVPVFSPFFTTINELFGRLANLVVADKVTLLYHLYLSYKDAVPNSDDTFDTFIHWGDVLLNDFDDIDKYFVDAGKIFANIKDLNEIGDLYSYLSEQQRDAVASFWGVYIKNKDNDNEKKFISLWETLYPIYTNFNKRLRSEGLAYEGMIYRQVAQGIIDKDSSVMEPLRRYSQIVFIGMNALNKCEKILFNYLQQEGLGDYYWDYYSDAIKDKFNKSSLFMEDNVARYHSKYQLPQDGGLPDDKPQINVISVPSAVGGVKYVHDILKDIVSKEGSDRMTSTAVVLPDENMLFPLLNSIPEEIDKINVTMGYPLSISDVGSLFKAIASLHGKYRTGRQSSQFYHSGVIPILNHPIVRAICPGESDALRKEIVSKNMIYVPVEKFTGEEYGNNLFKTIFQPLVPSEGMLFSSAEISAYLKAIVEECAESAGVDDIGKEFLLGYMKVLNLLSKLQIRIKSDTYFRLLNQLSALVSVPFTGEPLQGLQIMGPLETRSLDFENIIMVSMNEGTFPSASISPSMIPYNIRRAFELPTYEYQDSISAYHFYRSISRASNIYFIHNSAADTTKSSEVSRYIMQLELHHGYQINRKSVQYQILADDASVELKYEKDENVISRLSQMSFSPTSLQTYNDCPLKFYLNYIAKVKEEEEVSEEVDSGSFGTIFHYVMEHLYKDMVDQQVTVQYLQSLKKDKENIVSLIKEAYKEVLNIDEPDGKNLLLMRLFEKYVEFTLEADIARAPFTVIATEKKYYSQIRIKGIPTPVKINGTIDRMDADSQYTYVCDYKTGKDFQGKISPKHLFQLNFYLLLLRSLGSISLKTPTTLSIYYTRTIYNHKIASEVVTGESYDTFMSELQEIFTSIFDDSIPFAQCEEGSKCCEYCGYRLICRR